MPGFVIALLFAVKKIKWNTITVIHFVIAIFIFVLPFVLYHKFLFRADGQGIFASARQQDKKLGAFPRRIQRLSAEAEH